MENKFNILAVDHGNHSIKTPSLNFVSGLSSHAYAPQLSEEYISYKEKYWTLTGDVPPYKADKSETEDMFVYTLFACAKEAKEGRLNLSKKINLAVGLPPTHIAAYKKKYLGYFQERKKTRLIVNGAPGQDIEFGTIRVYAQGMAAMIAAQSDKQLKVQYASYPSYIIVDIGGGTADIIFMRDGRPIETQCATEEVGVLRMEEEIVRRAFRECDMRLKIRTVEDILLGRPSLFTSSDAPAETKKVLQIIRQEKKAAAERIANIVNELIGDAKTVPWIFEGAGSKMLQDELMQAENMSAAKEFLTDPHLNAKGYFIALEKELSKKG